MSGGPTIEQTGSTLQQLTALLVVVLCATVGGIIVQILMRGIEFTSGSVGPVRVKACLTSIQIPPLVGMILTGCLARNFLCTDYMQHYPEVTASWIRIVCLSIILLRGGMELDFAGKGLTVVLLTICPQFSEAIAAAIASRYIFNMPWALCFAQGFTLGAVSPAVVVPSLMILHKADYGTVKGIPTTLIAAASFDDIIAITVFSVFLSVGMNGAPKAGVDDSLYVEEPPLVDETTGDSLRFLSGGSGKEPWPIWMEIGFNVIQFIIGLIIAFGVGALMGCCNKFSVEATKWPKFLFCLFMGISIPIACDLIGIPETKFVAIIFFGYMCFQKWGENKPEHELAIFWMFCQPFLFGTVGAAVLFDKIEPSIIGRSFGTILIGVTARWIGTFMAAFEKKYTYRERAFMAFAWIPKATVQAALGGVMLMRAQADGLTDDYLEWGQAMLTTAVFSICITAPLGAIFINTLGTKWLNYDGDVDMNDVDDESPEKKPAITGGEDNAKLEDFEFHPEDKKIETGRGDAPAGTTVPQSEDAKTIKTDKVNEMN